MSAPLSAIKDFCTAQTIAREAATIKHLPRHQVSLEPK